MAERDGERSDPLFGPDGTTGAGVVGSGADGVGPLPGFELPAVQLPVIGPDGRVTGLAGSEDLDPEHRGSGDEPAAASSEDAADDGGPVRPGSSVEGATAESAAVDAESSITAGPRATARPHPPAPPGAPGDRPAATSPVGGVQYRPRIEAEPSILGLSRHTRGRFGARAFNIFFAGVFVLILIQLIVALLHA